MTKLTQVGLCSRCLEKHVVYSDIHPLAFTCAWCNQVNGIIWDDRSDVVEQSEYEVPAHLPSEGMYDWEWLAYTDNTWGQQGKINLKGGGSQKRKMQLSD